jgi:hypothetical protein
VEIQAEEILTLIVGLFCVGFINPNGGVANFKPKHLKRKQYLVRRPQSGLDTNT